MLAKLSIDNYILIRNLDIEFFQGFSVITGETGSGKSILLGAMSLVLGQRADTSALLDKSKKCVIEGNFRLTGYGLEPFFAMHDIDYDDITIIRREISPGGKSRAFINDTPVNLNLMKELGDKLVNIHSQNSVTTLNDTDFQLTVLDSYAHQTGTFASYRHDFKRYSALKKELDELRNKEARSKGELDYNRFLLDELSKAVLRENEQEESEQRLEILSHTEEIKGCLFKAAEKTGRAEINVLLLLNDIIAGLSAGSKYHPALEEIARRVKNNQIDLKDIFKEIERLEEDVHFDPEEIQQLTRRLDLVYRLQNKHQVKTVGELLLIAQQLETRIRDDNNLELQIKSTEKEMDRLYGELLRHAELISEGRFVVKNEFEKEVQAKLVQLGMPAAKFRVDITRNEEISNDGLNMVRFLFSANKGVEMSDLARVASGGELSRLMLTVKSMVSEKNLLPTIIFDEIDNGVSGDVAGKVGNILRKMSEEMQVIVITHLPQIAGKGGHHYNVFKSEDKDTATTLIRKLKNNERVEEIAKMMSNENITASALKTARELLGN
jgi:DNA repair protein RecN (Recombination protein N)